jgi:hypothetical protein
VSEAGWANPSIRRLCIAVGWGQAVAAATAADKRSVPVAVDVLDDVRRAAIPDRALWYCQPQDGGELVLLPPGVDEGHVIAEFTDEAGRALERHNRNRDPASPIQLRIAFHQGITLLSDSGYTGPAVRHICMLLNAQEFSDMLAASSSAELGIIVSQQIFEDVITHNSRDLRAAEFAHIQIANTNEQAVAAWIRIADRQLLAP